MSRQDLNGAWKIRWCDGQRGGMPHYIHSEDGLRCADILGIPKFIEDEYDEIKWVDAEVPGEIHRDLVNNGMIESPYDGTNVLKCRWVEENLWFYRKVFDAPQAAAANCCSLTFEGLDYGAVIYLNGKEMTRHENAFFPCVVDVRGALKSYGNILLVRLESGLYSASEKSGREHYTATMTMDALLTKRQWLRKPQSTMAWDWAPRLMNIGIFKPVYLAYSDDMIINQITVASALDDSLENGRLTVRAFAGAVHAGLTDIQVMVKLDGKKTAFAFANVPEDKTFTCELQIENPKLWWPRGYGEQNLYEVEVAVIVKGKQVAAARRKTGFRKVTVNQDRHPVEGNYFIFQINHMPVFAKGGNFVPSDLIVAGISDERYARLIDLAKQANFNFLRVWGGGIYESDRFYELCDENGIMVWQDFIAACATLPWKDDAFRKNIIKEAEFNIRRLSGYPSLIAWCGNNETLWGGSEYKNKFNIEEDYELYFQVLPALLKKEDPEKYYQPSSPYSEGGGDHNSPVTGDQHPWSVGFTNKDSRDYEKMVCRFPNEGGILGPASLPTVIRCLEKGDGIHSFAWQIHDNMLENWMPDSSPDQDVIFWLGRNPREMSIADYVYAGGLVQGEGLKRYIENFRRRKFSSSSAIFWMYNDCWPCTRSWTIVDYYLNKNPSYYHVKRAFADVAPVIALEDEKLRFYIVNDTPQEWRGRFRYGIFTLGGDYITDEMADVEVPGNSSEVCLTLDYRMIRAAGEDSAMPFALLYAEDGRLLSRTRYTKRKFNELRLEKADIKISASDGAAYFESSVFAAGVCLGLDGTENIGDNLFDLYPGQRYKVECGSPADLKVLYTLNDFLKTGDRKTKQLAARND